MLATELHLNQTDYVTLHKMLPHSLPHRIAVCIKCNNPMYDWMPWEEGKMQMWKINMKKALVKGY